MRTKKEDKLDSNGCSISNGKIKVLIYYKENANDKDRLEFFNDATRQFTGISFQTQGNSAYGLIGTPANLALAFEYVGAREKQRNLGNKINES